MCVRVDADTPKNIEPKEYRGLQSSRSLRWLCEQTCQHQPLTPLSSFLPLLLLLLRHLCVIFEYPPPRRRRSRRPRPPPRPRPLPPWTMIVGVFKVLFHGLVPVNTSPGSREILLEVFRDAPLF